MWKIALAVVLLSACGRRHAGPTIAVTAAGFVKLEGETVTLEELAARLAGQRDTAPLEDHPRGRRVSSLRVRLDIDDDVPWRHVLFVMGAVAEQRLPNLVFPGGRAVTMAVEPLYPLGDPEHQALRARVLVLDDGRYVIDERTTDDIREVGAWIEAAPMAFLDARVGMIRAQARAPWRRVAPVLDLFRGLGMTWIDFYCAESPTPEERRLKPLPTPPEGPRSRHWPGLVAVAYWPRLRYADDDHGVSEPRATFREAVDEHRLGLGLPALGYDEALGNAAFEVRSLTPFNER